MMRFGERDFELTVMVAFLGNSCSPRAVPIECRGSPVRQSLTEHQIPSVGLLLLDFASSSRIVERALSFKHRSSGVRMGRAKFLVHGAAF